MNRKEREMWLKQINRIHLEIKKQREKETLEQVMQITASRNEEQM